MIDGRKFLWFGIILAVISFSPLFVGFDIYNSAWDNPEDPTLEETVITYFQNAEDEVAFTGHAQFFYVISLMAMVFGIGVMIGKGQYEEEKGIDTQGDDVNE